MGEEIKFVEEVGISRSWLAILLIIALGAGFGAGWISGSLTGSQGGGFSATISIEGSNTLFELQQTWAINYMGNNTGIIINVGGAGSSVGYSQLIDGLIDIADASRLPKASENESAATFGVELNIIPVVIDGIVIVVHPNNDISNISFSCLRGIYNGTISGWIDVNASSSRAGNSITAYSRDPASGTFGFFQEHVMEDDDYGSSIQMLAGNSAIVSAVAADEDGIGYVGAAYAQTTQVRVIDVNSPDTGNPVEPTFENIKDFSYPIARHLYAVTNGRPAGFIAAYIDWCIGPEGQTIAESIGYIAAYELAGPS
ncbi:MAG: PstS family phosphate ABC transporter substrate-binding protein [Promethearchaeota archaeon]